MWVLCVFASTQASGNCKLVAPNVQNVLAISILGRYIPGTERSMLSETKKAPKNWLDEMGYGGWHVFKHKLAVGFQKDDILNLQLAGWLKCWFKVQAVLNIWLVILYGVLILP